jgi:hypothetical protein
MTTTVVKTVRINHPGDGAWVMGHAGGTFTDGSDAVFLSHRGEKRLGGIVATGNLSGSIMFHMGATESDWMSRDLLWLVFDFAFNQVGVRKVIATVASTNDTSMAITLRAGFRVEAVVRDATSDGHLMILTMERRACRWLNYKSRAWRSGMEAYDGR